MFSKGCNCKQNDPPNKISKVQNPWLLAGCLPKAEKDTVEKFSGNASLLGPNSLGKTLQVIDTTLTGRKQIALEDSDLTKNRITKS